MRATSSTRSDLPRVWTWETVLSALCDLLTLRWWLPWAATCGRWVTHKIWCDWPSWCNSFPTVSATAPPIPASTSSKISVGVNEALLVMTLMAKLIRANSPPDATLAKDRGVLPAWPATKNSICSKPFEPPSLRGVRQSRVDRQP